MFYYTLDLCREPLLQDADGFLSSCSKEHAVSDSSTFSLSSDVSTTKAFSRRSSDGDEKRQLYGTETVVTNNIVEDVDEGDNDRHTWRRNENPKIEELHDLKNPGNGYARTHCSKNGCFSQVRAPDASCQVSVDEVREQTKLSSDVAYGQSLRVSFRNQPIRCYSYENKPNDALSCAVAAERKE